MRKVLGGPVDKQTRCVHYRTPLDVVAIKFRCCGQYYPCHACHQESAGHPATRWPPTEHAAAVIFCGVCDHELSIREYLKVEDCPHCGAPFNPGGRLHSHLYFETATRQDRPPRHHAPVSTPGNEEPQGVDQEFAPGPGPP